MDGRPFQLQQEHAFIAHAASAPENGFDRRVHRFDDAEANGMVAVGGDPVNVAEEKVAETFHLRQPLPPQRLDPAENEVQHARAGLVGPEPIELFPQNVRLEQAAIRRERRMLLSDWPSLRQISRLKPRTASSNAQPSERSTGNHNGPAFVKESRTSGMPH